MAFFFLAESIIISVNVKGNHITVLSVFIGSTLLLSVLIGLTLLFSVLIVDEATEGLAPLVRLEIWNGLQRLREAGLSMIVIDKNIAPLLRLADRHVILEKGRVVWQGDSAALRAAPAVLHQYVGV